MRHPSRRMGWGAAVEGLWPHGPVSAHLGRSQAVADTSEADGNKSSPHKRSAMRGKGVARHGVVTRPKPALHYANAGYARYDFFAVDNLPNGPNADGHVATGQFNVTTDNSVELPSGDYTLSPRPYIPPKTGIAGDLQWLHQLWSGNASGDPNRHVGDPTLSNTLDWNTVQFPDGETKQGVMIHPGRDPATGEGGLSLGCLVTNNIDFGKLNQILEANYPRAYLRMMDPSK